MKVINVKRVEVHQALSACLAVAPGTAGGLVPLMIMSRGQDGGLEVTCRGSVATVVHKLAADGPELDRDLLIPLLNFHSWVNAVKNDVTLKVDEDPSRPIMCESGGSRLRLAVPSAQVPGPIQRPEPTMCVTVPAGDLHVKLRTIAVAMAPDNGSNFALKGIHLVIKRKLLKLEASDGHEMLIGELPCENDGSTSDSASVIMPKEAVNLMNGLLSKLHADHRVSIAAGNDRLSFKSGMWSVNVNLMALKRFPNLSQLMPPDSVNMMTLSRKDLAGALHRAMTFSDNGTVRLEPRGEDLIMRSRSTNAGDIEEALRILSKVGSPGELWVNGRVMEQLLQQLHVDEVSLEYGFATRQIVIKPVGSDEVHVTMEQIRPAGFSPEPEL